MLVGSVFSRAWAGGPLFTEKPTQIRFFTLIGPEQGHLPHAFQLAPLGSLLQLDGQVSVLLDSYFLPFFHPFVNERRVGRWRV